MAEDQAKREVPEAVDRRVSALLAKDSESFAALLADPLAYHYASGKVDSKNTYLSQFLDGRVTALASCRERVRIDIARRTAICRGIAGNDFDVGRRRIPTVSRFSGIWARQEDRWAMAAWLSVKFG